MKKLIASLLVLVFGATMVMAEVPAANAPQVMPSAFADVEGLPLDAQQADAVEGEGFLFGAIVGGCASAAVDAAYQKITTGKIDGKQVLKSAALGALGGAAGTVGSGFVSKATVLIDTGRGILGAMVSNAISPAVDKKIK
jgi:hypothetical protein